MFHSARIKLTIWYLAIIMAISLLFSVIIYQSANTEFRRFEHMQERITKNFERKIITLPPGQRGGPNLIIFTREDTDAIREARERFILIIGFINLSILIIAGTAGYFLAGRTLKPIKEMMDEQRRFVSDSSHELRTPLTSLRTEIEVALRNKKPKTENLKKILRSNLEEVIGLQTLSDNLLELAQNGKLLNKNAMERVSIRTIVQNALKRVGPSARSKQIKLPSHIPSGNVVYGVPDRLTEVFVILLDNSIKYSKKKGKVEIIFKQTGGKVEISVTDYGMGISEIDLPHIFDRFYRGDKSRTENGYGLGLSIAKKIIEAHGGKIMVQSIPGKQTEFIVTLPSQA